MKTYGGYPASVLVGTLTRLMSNQPGIKRSPLSRLVCEALGWRGVDGRLSEMTCRVTRVRQVLPTNVIQVTETQGVSGDFGGSL